MRVYDERVRGFPLLLLCMPSLPEIKLYFDYKSPYAYVAKAAAFELPLRYRVALRWIPFVLRIKGKGERSIYSEYKARYSYMDARRCADKQGGLVIRGPRKVYDSTPALVGGLFALRERFFRPFTDAVFERFFERELEIDQPDSIAALIAELGHDPDAYHRYRQGQGARDFDACQAEAAEDRAFGVPLFVFEGEQFWGQDRIGLLEERLTETGLQR